MKILFLGQRGIGAIQANQREKRVEALACELANAGHIVTVTYARPYIAANVKRYQGVRLIHHFSLDPQKPGGFVYNLFCLFTLWKMQPDVAHVHGWQAGFLLRLAHFISPETTFVWTIDQPSPRLRPASQLKKMIIWLSASAADVITTPTRQLQYCLRQELNLKTSYIPDGYHVPNVPDVPLRTLNLPAAGYSLMIANSTKQAHWVARAYKAAGLRKKLVTLDESIVGRQRTSLLRQAWLVIFAGEVATDDLLQTMNAGREIIATTNPHLEETLGVNAQFVKEGSLVQLKQALRAFRLGEVNLGAKATKRARLHFQWSRITSEYLACYHYPSIRTVPLDSIIGVQTPQTAVR